MSGSWKQAVFLGGAILVLAACSDVTAPQGSDLRAVSMGPVSATQSARLKKKSADGGGTVTPKDCRTGYSISVGFADSLGVGLCVR